MPVQFLNNAEREKFNNFPNHIYEEDIITFFTLSDSDKLEIKRQRTQQNQFGFAMQICALRFLGFSPKNLTQAPQQVIEYISIQLNIEPEILNNYGKRNKTRTEHQRLVEKYLGFQKASPQYLKILFEWLIKRAIEHDSPILLLQFAFEKLFKDKIVRPGITRIEQIVAKAQNKATKSIYNQLKPLLTKDVKKFLDNLLVPNKSTGNTTLYWLRKRAVSNSSKEILAGIEKLNSLIEANVNKWDLSFLNPNRQKILARIGRKGTNQYIHRLREDRRYPILIALLKQSLFDIIDEIIDMFIDALWDLYQDSKKDLEKFQKSIGKSANEKLIMFKKIGSVLADSKIIDPEVRPVAFKKVPLDELLKALNDTNKIIRKNGDDHIDYFYKRYSYIRQFSPTFIKTFDFKSDTPNMPLLNAIKLLREVNLKKGNRKIPQTAPTRFIPDQWKSYVINSDKSINTGYYELCVLWELRNSIRACNIWIQDSRKYANLDSYFIPPETWKNIKQEVCEMLNVPVDGKKWLKEKKVELLKLISRINKLLSNKDNKAGIRLENGKIVVSRIEAEDMPQSAIELEKEISKRLPKVDITDVIIEVDTWTNFSDCFVHASGAEPRTKEFLTNLYASILAQACNFGLDQMEDITGISYRKLAWCTTWYIREDTLKPAFSKIINYQHKLPFANNWGCGTLSSSDGQRLPVSVKTRHAKPLPKYFGYGQGLTYYTWTSSQFSQYGIKVTPSTMLDAPYVLDEILGNETDLEILEHTTDTAGQTEKIFGAFGLVGPLFTPRIKDIGTQKLYRFKSIDIKKYPKIKNRFKGIINEERLLKHWDDLLRIGGSLKTGWVTASLALQKLQNLPKKNTLSWVLQEYGRIEKTIHILKWYESEERRKRISLQLNKGEAIHALREFIFFANKGKIRKKYYEDQQNQAMCLNLVTNIVITWYTVYIEAVVEQLKLEGYQVNESDLEFIWPTRFANLNVHGKYTFKLKEELNRKGLRPLRNIDKSP